MVRDTSYLAKYHPRQVVNQCIFFKQKYVRFLKGLPEYSIEWVPNIAIPQVIENYWKLNTFVYDTVVFPHFRGHANIVLSLLSLSHKKLRTFHEISVSRNLYSYWENWLQPNSFPKKMIFYLTRHVLFFLHSSIPATRDFSQIPRNVVTSFHWPVWFYIILIILK